MGCFRLKLLVFNILLSSLFIGCKDSSNNIDTRNSDRTNNVNDNDFSFYLGADLSYINELEDFNAEYKFNGEIVDPFKHFSQSGCNITRVRLWNNPPTGYSDFNDVKKTIERAKNEKMHILLDFHYSDFWADPHKQTIPVAWKDISNVEILADSVYQYTYNTLSKLIDNNLAPELVQIGNETNIEILQKEDDTNTSEINWTRNSALFNAGIKAVNNINTAYNLNIKKVLHIAQPENAFDWFEKAFENNLTDFDIIGLSYYAKWSSYSLNEIPDAISSLQNEFKKSVLIVETAYPHSLQNVDAADNILGNDALIDGFNATPNGQLNYLIQLTKNVKKADGLGVIYWEPAWITSDAKTAWGIGSHWDNATFFDAYNNNEALPAFNFFNKENY
ncbi:MAG: hypothetical protein BM563_04055 [Bacteroidetes bacterium MedPE-SWsnd-G1]|nr:MAG: hypothetical protein BM563_04055 [Bacteroidetes bacterium MedPE-SWsnd-G1]